MGSESYKSIGLFCLSLGAGWVVSLLFVAWSKIPRKYFLMNAAFAALFGGVGGVLLWRGGAGAHGPLAVAAALVALLVALLFLPDAIARVCLWLASLASLGGVFLATRAAWPFAAAVSGGVAMGTVLSAMILGHWYLAGPGLSFDLLVRASKVFLGSLVVRLAIVVAVLVVYQDLGTLGGIVSNSSKEVFRSGVLWTRIVAGLGAPIVFAWMVWQCAKIKSNQSATGILYATISFVLVGELLAQYYRIQTNVPV